MPEKSIKKRKPRGSLSKDVILTAAKELLHREGIDSLSIRKIANELKAGPMSIYNHYETKQEIVFDLVTDFVHRAHQRNYPKTDWQHWLSHTFLDIYQASIGEQEYLTLMISSNNIGVASLSVFEESLACLIESGFTPKDASIAFHRLLSFTLGAALLQVNLMHQEASKEDKEQTNTAINEANHPYSSKHWEQAHSVMMGNEFEYSLKAIILGLEHHAKH